MQHLQLHFDNIVLSHPKFVRHLLRRPIQRLLIILKHTWQHINHKYIQY